MSKLERWGSILVSGLVIAVGILVCAFYLSNHTRVSLGSVPQGSEYLSTTTPVIAANFPTIALLSGATSTITSGSLGSITITKTDTGTLCLYDATTTDITLRASTQATSTILLTCFAASPTAGTYTYDVRYVRGLLEVSTTPIASTTIIYR